MAESMKFGADTINVGVSKAYEMVQGKFNSVKSKPNEIAQDLAVLNKVVDSTTKTFNILNTVDANKARADAKGLVYSEEFTTASPIDQKSMIDREIQEKVVEGTNAYQEAYTSTIGATYSNVTERVHKEKQRIAYNQSAAVINTNTDAEVAKGADPQKALQESIDLYADTNKELNLDKSELKQAALFDRLDIVKEYIQSGELDTAKEYYTDVLDKYSSKQFLGTTSAKGRQAIAAKRREIENLFKQEAINDKNESYHFLAKVELEGNRELPQVVNYHIDKVSSNELVAAKQKKAYAEKYTQVVEADNFALNNPIGERKEPLPTNNPIVSQQREKQVTQALASTFDKSDLPNFVRIAANEVSLTSKAGEYVKSEFNSLSTPQDLHNFMNKIEVINQLPNGSTVMRQLVSNDTYAKMIAIKGLSIAFPDKSLSEIKADVARLDNLEGRPKLDTMTMMEIQNRAKNMGSHASEYINTMNKVIKLNPDLASSDWKTIAKRFEANYREDKTGDKKEDTTNAPSPTDDRSIIDGKAADREINKNLPKNTTEKMYFPDNVVVAKDNLGGTLVIRNVKGAVEKAEETTISTLLQQQKDETDAIKRGEFIPTLKYTVSSAIRNFVDNPTSPFTSIKEVSDTILNDVVDSVGTDNIDLGGNTEGKLDSLTLAEYLEKEKETYPTKLPEVPNEGISEYDKQVIPYALEANKNTLQAIDKVKSKILEEGQQKVYDFSNTVDVGAQVISSLATKAPKEAGVKFDSNQFVEGMLNHILSEEGTGDNVTGITTGKYGVTERTKQLLEDKVGRKLNDEEAATYLISSIVSKLEDFNPELSLAHITALIPTLYNLGTGALDWESFKKYQKNPTEYTLQRAILTKIYTNQKASIGIAYRRAKDYNLANPSEPIGNIVMDDEGNVVYFSTEGKKIFEVKNKTGVIDKSSKSRKLKIK